MNLPLFLKFIISLLLGSIIGLERETGNEKKPELWTLGGVRTFALIAFLGSLSGFLLSSNNFVLSNIITCFVFISILIYYFITAFKANTTGLTTEISALFAYLIGFFILTNIISISVVVAFAIILILILSNKQRSKKFASNINQNEWNSFLSFAIILLVILPFLPNINYTWSDFTFLKNLPIDYRLYNLEIINPYHLWLIVVLISGINLLGYILNKKFGKNKSFYLCGFFGGIMSSTLTNHLLSEKSKIESTSNQHSLAVSNTLAYIASIIHASFFIILLNFPLFIKILPCFIILIFISIFYILFLKKQTSKLCPVDLDINIQEKPDILLLPAIKFALLITFIKIISGLSFIYWGNNGFFITSTISSFAGVDAIIINISEMARKTINVNYAILAILIVNIFNLFWKWIYSLWKGSKIFSKFNFILLFLIFFSSLIWYLFLI